MASLANQTISSTYDGLIKTSTDQPVPISGVQLLEDGVGNSLALSVGRANQGVTVTGTLTATSISGVLADGVTATTQTLGDNSTKVATTAYVDAQVTASDLDFAGDSGTGAVDLDSQTFTIAGTANEIETVASGQTVTIGLPSSVTVGTLNATNVGGTLSTAAQPNITSVGTLTGLDVGNISMANALPTITMTDTDLTDVYARVRASAGGFLFEADEANQQADTTIRFEIDAVERLRIDSSGNVGIGGTPVVALDVQRTQTGTSQGGYPSIRVINKEAGATSLSSMDTLSSNGGVHVQVAAITSGGQSYGRISTLTNQDLRFLTNSTEKLRILSSGGITFNGDTAAANALDDYEEGLWTMGISFGGASVGVTYSANEGRYTKIGNMVTVTGRLTLTNKGTSVGDARITGLPFSVPNNNGFRAPATVNFNLVSFANQFQAIVQIASSDIVLAEITEAGSYSGLNQSNFANNSVIDVQATYFV